MSAGKDCSCDGTINQDCAKTYVDPCVFPTLVASCNAFTSGYPDGENLYKAFIDAGGPHGQGFLAALQQVLSSGNKRKNQIIYDMCQLAGARVECEEGYVPGKSPFSGDWWKKTIWGEYPVQHVIYLLSLLVMVYLNIKILTEMVVGEDNGVFSFISPTLKEMTSNVGPGDGNMIPIIVTVIALLVFVTILVNYMTREGNESDEEMDDKRQRGVVVLVTVAVFIFLLSIAFTMFQGDGEGGPLGIFSDLLNLSSFAMFLLFNFALSAYVPQLMLVAILLQRFFFTPWSFDFSTYKTGFSALSRVGAYISVLGIMFWYLGQAGFTTTGPAQVLAGVFIAFMTLMFGQSVFLAVTEKLTNNSDAYESTWSLVMMPLFQMAFAFFRPDFTIANIMVKNAQIF